MAHRRYRNEILTAFHNLPPEDKRGILAIFRRFILKRRLSVVTPPRPPAPGSDPVGGPELGPPARSGRARSSGARSRSGRSKPRSS
jgi:hypothetical protein